MLGRTLSKCDAVVAEIEARGGTALAAGCDVEQREQIESAVELIVARWGRVDLLVNNAQSMFYASIRKLTDDQMNAMWHSGPMAAFRFMQICFAHLRETKGGVINMGSGDFAHSARSLG